MKTTFTRLFLSIPFVLWSHILLSQIAIGTSLTPQQLVQDVLIGQGVVVNNITYTGAAHAIGSFSNGGTTNLGLSEGIALTTGSVHIIPGPNTQPGAGVNNNLPGHPLLQSLVPGFTTYDAAVIEFEFIPLSDTIQFRYVFGSEEYPEYAGSSFNDVFGFFISGPNPAGGTYNNHNIALLPGTNIPVSINTVNNGTNNTGPCINCQYYIDNTGGMTLEYDAITTVLTARAAVVPCVPYQIVIGIADAGDGILDSGVFLEANSFSTDALEVKTKYTIPSIPYTIEGCNDAIITISMNNFATDTVWIPIDTIYGTATNGVDYPFIPNYAYILPGYKTTTITISPYVDSIPEGVEYVIIVIPTSPCTIDTIIIPIIDYIPISLDIMNDTLVCEDPLQLYVDPGYGAPPYNYSWTPVATITNPNVQNPTVHPTVNTTYVVTVSDTSGCPAVSDSVNVTLSPKPMISFMPDLFSACEPHTVQFSDYSSPNIVQWFWDFGDGNTSTDKNPSNTYTAGLYTVSLTVTSADGCSGTMTVPDLIEAYPTPQPYFDPSPAITTIDNPTIFFDNMSIGGSTYYWDFGDPGGGSNNNSTAHSPSYTYTNDGVYTVWLIVHSANGCIDSVSREVMIIVDEIEIPNVITPNGDGFNDNFYIKNIDKLKYSRLIIYNRWGNKVFEMENYDNSWDARNNPDGVYFWTLEYSTYFRDTKEHGTVTVLRGR